MRSGAGSGELDDELAERSVLAEVEERLGDVIQRVRPFDHGLQRAVECQLTGTSHVLLVRAHQEHPDAALLGREQAADEEDGHGRREAEEDLAESGIENGPAGKEGDGRTDDEQADRAQERAADGPGHAAQEEERNHGDDRPGGKEQERGDRRFPGRAAQFLGIDPQLVAEEIELLAIGYVIVPHGSHHLDSVFFSKLCRVALKCLPSADLRSHCLDRLDGEELVGEPVRLVGGRRDRDVVHALYHADRCALEGRLRAGKVHQARAFVDPGDTIVAAYPTYTLYEVLCRLHGCSLNYIPLDDDFQLTPEFYAARGRLCFLTRPNAPTGVAYPREEVKRFCDAFKGIVLIDEAYVDFGDDSCMDFPEQFDNVIVTRTFSKSYGLAGLRIGTAVARPELIREFVKIKDSYNLNTFSQAAGLAAIEDQDYMKMRTAQIRASRARLRDALLDMGFLVPESSSNFLLARWNGTPSAAALFEALREHHVLVRYFPQPRLKNALRISIGTDEECDRLIDALRDIITR